jgi:DNA repair protein RecN (Recombination protein N)
VLVELRVENYAVMDSVAVEFGPGLNLLTGETGAGKSLLVDALALLLGEKASPDVVRHGADRATLTAVFEPDSATAAAILDQNGIHCESADEPIIVRREISAAGTAGKPRVFINSQPATVAVLRQLAPALAAIHSQRESLVAFDATTRLALLDQFSGVETGHAPSPSDIATAFAEYNSLRQQLANFERDEQDRLRLADLWSFQKKEIEAARLERGEDEHLESEKRVLANAEKIHAAALSAYDALYDGAASAAASIRAAARQLEELARFDTRFQESLAALDSARITVEDLGAELRDYAAGVEASPERLAEVEDRLALLDRLKRKYGTCGTAASAVPTLADVIAFGEDVAQKLRAVENREEVLRELRGALAAAGERYLVAASALSRTRYAAAKKLEKLVEAEVNDLAMRATFRVQLSGTDDAANWTVSGFDQVEYLIATNPGEPLRPLAQIASGGELSRVMLALKVAVQSSSKAPASRRNGKPKTNDQRPTTLVFDEIDVGIGGRAAESVGRKLKELARSYQLLCVTHLPQIASFADQHFAIEKHEHAGRTRTTIRSLDADERTLELARMLSGARVTDASLKNAEQMLKANA